MLYKHDRISSIILNYIAYNFYVNFFSCFALNMHVLARVRSNCSDLEVGSESFSRILVIINQLTQVYMREDLNTGTSAKQQCPRYRQVEIHQAVMQECNMLELKQFKQLDVTCQCDLKCRVVMMLTAVTM